MAASDATPLPVKNQAYRVTFPIYDNDGDLVTAAAGLDSEISKDAGTFTDCTNEATEIATSSGMYYLDLTATEMNADTVAIIVKTTTTDAKTTPIVLYPQDNGLDRAVNVTHWNSVALATTNPLPNAAADAAGGLPISDAGGLDMDGIKSDTAAILVDTAEIGAAGAGLTEAGGTGDHLTALATAANLATVDTVVDAILALLDDARGEPAQGAPPVNPDLATKIDYLYKAWRNKKDNDGSTTNLYADDGTTVDHKQTTTASGGTVTKGEWTTGP